MSGENYNKQKDKRLITKEKGEGMVLREYGEEISFGEVVGEAADEDVSGVLVLGVPRCLIGYPQRRLRGSNLLSSLYQR